MSECYEVEGWQDYKMDYDRPHEELEPIVKEVEVVGAGLKILESRGILPHTSYDADKMLAHRQMVRDEFEIPWTAITPRMQRLLYAISAIVQPRIAVAAGIFCGNTFVSCVAGGVGEGACYDPDRLIGVEIERKSAELARKNLTKIDKNKVVEIKCEDAIDTAANFEGQIELLYLDADGGPDKGKGIYLDILKAAYDKLPTGAVVLAHNSVNCADRLKSYLAFVRDQSHMRASMNMIIDPEGLEVSVK